jgi:hypothetical protein
MIRDENASHSGTSSIALAHPACDHEWPPGHTSQRRPLQAKTSLPRAPMQIVSFRNESVMRHHVDGPTHCSCPQHLLPSIRQSWVAGALTN